MRRGKRILSLLLALALILCLSLDAGNVQAADQTNTGTSGENNTSGGEDTNTNSDTNSDTDSTANDQETTEPVKKTVKNGWIKGKSKWIYYKNNKAKFKSNAMHKAWKKIKKKSSKTKYFIVVDLDACRTFVFKKSKKTWIPYKLFVCSPGKSSTPTVKGTYTIKSKGYSFGGSSYTCYYYTQFYGGYLFHSVLYHHNSHRIKDGRLGKHLSHGCVRLAIENAKWIYKKIPRGTKVYIY